MHAFCPGTLTNYQGLATAPGKLTGAHNLQALPTQAALNAAGRCWPAGRMPDLFSRSTDTRVGGSPEGPAALSMEDLLASVSVERRPDSGGRPWSSLKRWSLFRAKALSKLEDRASLPGGSCGARSTLCP